MGRRLVAAEVPDGTRLGFSRDGEGGMRGLLFDDETNHLVGHATLYDVDDHSLDTPQGNSDSSPQRDEDLDVFVEIMAQALASLAIYGIEKAAPPVRNWLKDKAVPAVKSTAVPAVKALPGRVIATPGKVKARLKRETDSKTTEDGHVVADMVTFGGADASANANGQASGVQVRGPVMSSTEAGQLLSRVVAATAFAREQMRVLHTATIVDDEGPVALASMLNELSPQHLEDAIRSVLAANPRMLERSTSTAIAASLQTRHPDVDLLPLSGAGAEHRTALGRDPL